MKAYYDHKPSICETYSYGKCLINYNITETKKQIDDDVITEWECDQVIVDQPLDYGTLVSAIIRKKYSADSIEAIILNYGDGDEVHTQEYVELQEYRREAKNIAKDILNNI